jgi:hypothetical protein
MNRTTSETSEIASLASPKSTTNRQLARADTCISHEVKKGAEDGGSDYLSGILRTEAARE